MDIAQWALHHRPRLGTLVTIDHPAIVEIAGLAGFDWLWIDAEHGSFTEVSASVACAVNSGGPPAFIRLPDHAPTTIKRFLDSGCDGIILPQISTVADVEQIARAALYPPRGERSVGIARAQGYGARFQEYLQVKNYAILVQIETVAGVQNAAEIIAHEAVDAVIIGPYDLSGSFGIPGEIEAPQVVESIARVLSICKSTGRPCGIFAATPDSAQAYAAAGFDLIAIGLDTTVLLSAWKSIRQRFA